MSNLTKTFKKRAATAAFLCASFVALPASALASVTVQPYDNLSLTGQTTVTVNGTGLEPNSEIMISQQSLAPYSEAEGDAVGMTGVKLERAGKGSVTTSASGSISTQVTVAYDPLVNGSVNINYCDFNRANDVRRLCYLELRYLDGPLASEVIIQHPLYFGMADPNGGGGGDPDDPPTPVAPVTKDDCKDEKWSSYTSLGFTNQGDCVSSVAARSK